MTFIQVFNFFDSIFYIHFNLRTSHTIIKKLTDDGQLSGYFNICSPVGLRDKYKKNRTIQKKYIHKTNKKQTIVIQNLYKQIQKRKIGKKVEKKSFYKIYSNKTWSILCGFLIYFIIVVSILLFVQGWNLLFPDSITLRILSELRETNELSIHVTRS